MKVVDSAHMKSHTRLVLVDDEALYLDLLMVALASRPRFKVIGAFGNYGDALESIPDLAPDVAILDITLGDGPSGIDLGVRLRRMMPDLGIVLLSGFGDLQLMSSIPREVQGGWSYLLKNSIKNVDSLARCVEGAAEGLVVLDRMLTARAKARPRGPLGSMTERQIEVLSLVAQGMSNAAIAKQLSLAEKSVENQLTKIYAALGIRALDAGVHARVQATLKFIEGSVAAAT